MSRQPATFADRLALARALITTGVSPAPVHLADQLGAAGREVRQIHDRLASVLPMIAPGRSWRQRMDADPSDETRAYLLATVLGCTTVCLHLRRGGPRSAIARLALRRVDCERCIGTVRLPPTDEGERCDVCGARGVVTFHPFAVRLGPVLLVGDACAACAGVLGIRFAGVAS